MNRLPNFNQLHAYLCYRRCALRNLRDDLRCHPFSKSKNAPKIALMVDWSEVHAYIFGGAAPLTDVLRNIVPESLVEAAHQAALTVLFEQIPLPQIMLPPYVSEMINFVEAVRRRNEITDLSHYKYLNSVEEVRNTSSVMGKFVEFVNKWKKDKATRRRKLTYNNASAHFSSENQIEIQGWISREFGDLLWLARLSTIDVFGNLRFLLNGEGNSPPRLLTVRDEYPEFVPILTASTDRILAWDARLRNVFEHKDTFARHRDAVALDYLDRLNGNLHALGAQLLFTSRGLDLKKVIEQHAGRFVCLSEQYFPYGQISEVPSITRDWHYFFEMGVIWDRRSIERTRLNLAKRLDGVETLIEWLESGARSTSEVQKVCKLDLNRALRNKETFVSTKNPRLPVSQTGTREDRLLAFFVKYVTNSESFADSRKQIHQEIERNLSDLVQDLSFVYKTETKHRIGSGMFHSLTDLLLRSLPRKLLQPRAKECPTWVRRGLRTLFNDLLSHGRKLNLSDEMKNKIRQSRIYFTGSVDLQDSRNRTELVFYALVVYACGATRRLYDLLQRTGDLRLHACSANWILLSVLQADVFLTLKRSPVEANKFFRNQWEEARGIDDARSDEGLRALTFLNIWLHMNLDWARSISLEEDISRDADREINDLTYIVSEIERISRKDSVFELSRVYAKLKYSILNNQLHALTIKAWDVYLKGLEPKNRGKGMLENARSILGIKSCTKLVDILSRSRNKPSAILDSLGTYYAVRAQFVDTHDYNEKKFLIQRAENYLLNASADEGDKITQYAIHDHCRFLRGVKSGLHNYSA